MESTSIGPFEIIGNLGSGPRGTVYRARHTSQGRVVAIKQLAAMLAPDGPEFTRLWNEVARLRAVVSNHVATTHSVEIFDGRPLIEMESLGESLERVTNGHPLVLRDAMRAIQDVLAGLKVLHDAGIIHDNLKPSNVLQDTTTGSWKVSDGGTTAIEAQSSPTLLATSVLYVAPETLLRHSQSSERSDLYCVGMLCLEAVLGSDRLREAFPQVPNIYSPSRWLAWLEDPAERAVPLRQLRPDTPEAISEFISRLLSKDPGVRFPSAFAATVELEAILLTLEPVRTDPAPQTAAGETPTISGSGSTRHQQESAPWLVVTGPEGFNQRIDLSDRTYRIGRDQQNDIVLPDDSKTVSRIHAELRRDGNRYTLIDLDSQNGLLVNGRRKPSVQLQPGVAVKLGAFTLTFSAPVVAADIPATSVKHAPAALAPARTVAGKPATDSAAKAATHGFGTAIPKWRPPKNAQQWTAAGAVIAIVAASILWFAWPRPSPVAAGPDGFVSGGTPVAPPPPAPVSSPAEIEKPKEEVQAGTAPPEPTQSASPTPPPVGRRGQNKPATGSGSRGGPGADATSTGPAVIAPTDAEKLEQARNERSFPRAFQLLEEIRKSNSAQPGLLKAAGQIGSAAEGAHDRDTASKLFKLVHDLAPASVEAQDLTAQGLKALKEAKEDATDDMLKSRAAEGYEKAIRYLPDGHPGKKDAQDRLRKLRGGLGVV